MKPLHFPVMPFGITNYVKMVAYRTQKIDIRILALAAVGHIFGVKQLNTISNIVLKLNDEIPKIQQLVESLKRVPTYVSTTPRSLIQFSVSIGDTGYYLNPDCYYVSYTVSQ